MPMTLLEEANELMEEFESLISDDIEYQFAMSLSTTPGLRQRLEANREPLRDRIRTFRRRLELLEL